MHPTRKLKEKADRRVAFCATRSFGDLLKAYVWTLNNIVQFSRGGGGGGEEG